MRRRDFIAGLGGAAAAWPAVATGQQTKMPILGYLHSGSPNGHRARVAAFRQGLADMGYFDGQNISLEYRWAEDNFGRLPSLAKSLLERQVDVIAAAGGDVAVLAAKAATSAIPIVFAVGDDPVQQGIVASLNRPGGNLTGITFLAVELRPKMVEFLREMLPNAKTIAILANPYRSHFEEHAAEVQRALSHAGLGARLIKAGNESEIEKALSDMDQVDSVLILSDPVYTSRSRQIARILLGRKIPSVSQRDIVVAGGLLGYGANIEEAYRQAGAYSGRVLKGEKPSDLPVLQPTRFELVINLKTARLLGITVPATLLARADEVIE